eukprot:1569037-Amphidinium_carterae.1
MSMRTTLSPANGCRCRHGELESIDELNPSEKSFPYELRKATLKTIKLVERRTVSMRCRKAQTQGKVPKAQT